jgi:DNA helicase-2/ATP-dependent DNA helicase PcrA
MHGKMAQKEGQFTSILARTNSGLRIFETAMTEAKIPYHLVGKSGFWSQPEVKAILAYLGCCSYPADWLIAGAIRAPFWPSKFLPKTKLLAALKEQQQCETDPGRKGAYFAYLVRIPETLVDAKNLKSLSEFTAFLHSLSRYRDLPPADALKSVISALKAVEYYSVEEDHIDNDPVQNLIELVKLAGRYTTIRDFLDFTRRASAASKSKKGVALSTIHGFKGAEADVIYVVGVSEGVLPHVKATDLQEEQNIWFTACSRPRHRLVITYSGIPSPFLKNCGIMPVKESE